MEVDGGGVEDGAVEELGGTELLDGAGWLDDGIGAEVLGWGRSEGVIVGPAGGGCCPAKPAV